MAVQPRHEAVQRRVSDLLLSHRPSGGCRSVVNQTCVGISAHIEFNLCDLHTGSHWACGTLEVARCV